MVRTALLVCAGIIAAAGVACVPAPPAPAPPPPAAAMAAAAPPPIAVSGICSDAQSFVDAVQLLPLGPSGYDPNPQSGPYKPPAGTPYTWPKPVQDDLRAAFSRAPPFFRQHLCGLSGIYISCPIGPKNTCDFSQPPGLFAGAWGFRSRGATDLGSTYVAISAGLWPAGAAAPKLHLYETRILDSFQGSTGATVYGATPDDTWATVLAALAHEVGHVRWTMTTRPTPGGTHDFGPLMRCPAGDFFAAWAYNHQNPDHPHLRPKKGWRGFADRLNDADDNKSIDHTISPTLKDLKDAAPPASYALLYQLYQAGEPWASLFAAQTPDEDFVETYVMAVLTGYANTAGGASFAGPLQSLPLKIPNWTGPAIAERWADVPRDLLAGRKPALTNKMSCLLY